MQILRALCRVLCLWLLAAAVPAAAAEPTDRQYLVCRNSPKQVTEAEAIAACGKWLKSAAATPDQKVWGLFRRGAHLVNAGESASAIQDLTEVMSLQPTWAAPPLWRAAAYFDRRDYARALADVNRSLEQEASGPAHLYRGKIYSQLGDENRAIADFDRALELNKNLTDAYNDRGMARARLRQYDAAIADFQALTDRSPSAGAWIHLCLSLTVVNRQEEARRACAAAEKLEQTEADRVRRRGVLALIHGQSQQAWDEFNAAHALESTDPRTLYGRGLAALRLGRTSDGRSDIAQALRIHEGAAASFQAWGLAPDASAKSAHQAQVQAAPSPPASNLKAGPRLALVIGISSYGTLGDLPNPVNDGRAVASALQGLGFDVDLILDPDQRVLRQAISRLGERMSRAGSGATGLFYFAGHGIQARGANYLIPAKARISREADLAIEAIQADAVLLQMQEAGASTNIIILDACRNMPLTRSFRNSGRGLAQMEAPNGTFIAYSTAPGSVASDGTGTNSPFAEALMSEIKRPGQPIETIFRNVRRSVLKATDGQQTPWDSSSLLDPFYFAGG